MDLNKLINQFRFDQYVAFLKSTGLSDSSIKRKNSSLSAFQKFLETKKLVTPFEKPAIISTSTSKFSLKLGKVRLPKFDSFKAKNKYLFWYLSAVAVAIILAGLSYTLYSQTILKAKKNLAYSTASSPIHASRYLSFQGRLTDSSGNPISVSTPILFKLFDSEAIGTGNSLYVSSTGNSQTVTPDENGIFSVIIGKSHGVEIPSSVFTENPSVFLEITAGGETMSPRQQIATVGYAQNAETLQGLPPSASGNKNTVMVIDNLGNLNLGETSPTIKSTSGTLGITGQAVLIQSNSGSGGNITLNPDLKGQTILKFSGSNPNDNTGFVKASADANFASGSLYYGQALTTANSFDFLDFQNYAVGTTQLTSRFTVHGNGSVNVGATLTAANISIGSTLITATAREINLLDGLTSTNGSIVIGNGSSLSNLNVGASGYVLVSNGTAPTWVSNSSIGTTYSVGSGLTLAGNVFKLGGPITENTRLNIGNTEVMYFNFSNGNVGIGTSNPLQKLQVNNVGTSVFTITANGSIGIGTTSPLSKLHLVDSTSSSGTISQIIGSALSSGIGLQIGSSSVTSGQLIRLTQNNSSMTGTGLYMDLGIGSTTQFTGNFLDLRNTGSSVFNINYRGGITQNYTTPIAGLASNLNNLTFNNTRQDANSYYGLSITGNATVIVSSTGTGATEPMQDVYEGFRFNSGIYNSISGVSFRFKKNIGTTTPNTGAYVRAYLYNDTGSTMPAGTSLVYSSNLYLNQISTSFTNYSLNLGATLVPNTNYWVVLRRVSMDATDITFEGSSVGTTEWANSPDGVNWTAGTSTFKGYYTVYTQSSGGVYGNSYGGYGLYGISTQGNGIRGASTSGIGVYGSSTYSLGALFSSSQGIENDVNASSSNGFYNFTQYQRTGDRYLDQQYNTWFTGNAQEIQAGNPVYTGYYYYYDGVGTTFINYSAAATQYAGSTYPVIINPTDYFYFGRSSSNSSYRNIFFNFSNTPSLIGVTWEYAGGTDPVTGDCAWTQFTPTADETNGLSTSGMVTITTNSLALCHTAAAFGSPTPTQYWFRVSAPGGVTTPAYATASNFGMFSGYFNRFYSSGIEKYRVNYDGYTYAAGPVYPGSNGSEGSIQTSRYLYDTGSALGTNSNFYVSGNLGVGTTPNANKIDVAGAIGISPNYPLIMKSGSTSYGGGLRYDTNSSENLIMATTNAATKMIFATGFNVTSNQGSSSNVPTTIGLAISNNNIGIGTSAPLYQLHTTGVALIGTKLGVGATGAATFNVSGNGNITTNFSIGSTLTVTGRSILTAGFDSNALSTVAGLNIDAAGSLQIGGTTVIDSNKFFYAPNGTSATPGYSFLTDTNSGLYHPSLDNLSLNVGATEALRVLSSGFVGIGTTNPNNTLEVVGTADIKSAVNSATAFQVLNSNNQPLFNVDTTNSINIITNSGYETDTTGWATILNATATRTTAMKYHGIASLQVGTSAAAGSGVSTNLFTQVINTGTTYTLSFYARAAANGFNSLQAGHADDGVTQTPCTLNSTSVPRNGFARFTCTFTTGTVSGSPYIYISQSDATARTFYIDAAQLEVGTQASPYTIGAIQLRGVVNAPAAFQSLSDSVSAFQIQNSAGNSNIFVVDTLNNHIGIGTSSAIDTLQVATGNAYFGSGSIGITNPNNVNVRVDGNLSVGGTLFGDGSGLSNITASQVSFDKITTGTNTTATMTLGTGASLTYTGSGVVNASQLQAATWASPLAIGTGAANTALFTYAGIGTGATNPLYVLSVGATASFNTLYTSGSVGIGTSTPGTKLDVQTSGYGFPATSGSVQTYGGLRISPPSSAGNVVLDTGVNTSYGAWLQVALRSDLSTNYPLLLNPNGGNIGIGNSSPAYKLHVTGDALISTRLGIGATNGSFAFNVSGNGNITGNLNVGSTITAAQAVISSLTSNQLILGGGAGRLTSLGTGATNQVLHGNPSGAPTWGSVLLGTETTGNYVATFNSLFGNISLVGGTDISVVAVGNTLTVNDLSTLQTVTGRGATTTNIISLNGGAYFPGSGIWNASGSVGIGTTAITGKLQVNGGDINISDLNNWNNAQPRNSDRISLLAGIKGRQINDNPDFLKGTAGYGVYDNAGSGNVSFALIGDTTSPNASNQILQITVANGATAPNPGFGGFYKSTSLCSTTAVGHCIRMGNRNIIRIWAKIPSGYTMNWASNSMGTGGNQQWLSPVAGTGNWEEYITSVTLGPGASSTNYFYITGASRPVTWYVAQVDMIDTDQVADVDRATSLNVGYQANVNLGTGQMLTTSSSFLATTAGSVGIGTTSPLGKLQIIGGDVYFGNGAIGTTKAGVVNVRIDGNLSVGGTLFGDGSGLSNITASQVSFDKITTGTNTTATMTLGTGASLTYTGSGVVNASQLQAATWASPLAIGNGTANTALFTRLGVGATSATAIFNVTGNGNVTGNLSVGKTLSAASLNISGTMVIDSNKFFYAPNGTVTTPGYSFITDFNTGLYHPSLDNLSLDVGGTEALRVLSNGFVGIGTTNPSNTLEVVGTADIKTAINSTTAFQVLNSNNQPLFNVDTTNSLNIITNSGFEVDVSGWFSILNATPIRNTAVKYHGIASMQIGTSASAASGVGTSNFTQALGTGTTYTLSFYARTSAGSFNNLEAGHADNGVTKTPCTLNSTNVNTGWRRYTCTFAAGAISGSPFIYIDQTDSTARTFYVDAVQLEVGNQASPYTIGAIQLRGIVNAPATFQSVSDSITAFQIQNSTGNSNLFIADTLDNAIGIGTSSPSGKLQVVGGDAYFGSGSIGITNPNNVNVRVDGNLSVGGTLFGDGSGLSNITATQISFSGISSGTNIGATMIVSTGASLSYNGSGVINASQLQAATWASPLAIGTGAANTALFTYAGIGTGATNPLYVLSVGATASFNNIFTSGSVGIGTTAPSANLEIYGGAGSTLKLSTSTSTLYGSINYNPTYGSSLNLTNASATGYVNLNVGTTTVLTAFGSSIGIGTTAPGAYKLNVAGPGYFLNNLQIGGTFIGDGSGLTNILATKMTFAGLTSGTNIGATMVVGTGASLSYTGTGVINASQLQAATWGSPLAIGNGTANTALFTRLGVGATSATAIFNVTGNGNVTGNLNIGGSLTVGSIPSVTDNNKVLTYNGTTFSYIDTSTWDKNSSGNYSGWTLQANGANSTNIGNTATVNFVGGTNISIAKSGNTLTINNTASAYTASNGISLVGNDIRLGGLLTQDTDIGFSGFNLSFSDSGSNLATFNASAITFNAPANFTSSGDVSNAYDLNFTNQTASAIHTNAPFVIDVGENFESNNLTLRTYNSGRVVFDTNTLYSNQAQSWILANSTSALNIDYGLLNIDAVNNRVGIGTTNGTAAFNVGTNGSIGTNLSVGATLTVTGKSILTAGFDSNAASTITSLTLDGNSGTALSISGTSFTTDISLQNGATIDNHINGSLRLTATNTNLTGNLQIGGTTVIDSNKFFYAPNGTALTPGYSFLTDTNSGLYHPALDNLSLDVGGTEALRILTSGYVGVGTTNPTAKLTVAGVSGLTRAVSIDNREIQFRGDGLTHFSIFGPETGFNYLTIQNTSSNSLIGTTGPDLLTILPGGNIGIATTNPLYKLDVAGNANFASGVSIGGTSVISATQTFLASLGTSAAPSFSFSADTNTGIFSPGSDIIAIGTSGVERFRIDNLGNVGIATTSPQYPLSVGTSIGGDLNGSLFAQKFIDIGNTRYSLIPSNSDPAKNSLSLYSSGSIKWNTNDIASTPTNLIAAVASRIQNFANGLLLGVSSTNTAGATITGWDNGIFLGIGSSIGIGTTVPLGPFHMKIGATEALFVSSAGRVGIGTTAPVAKLNINDGGTAAAASEILALSTTYTGNYAPKAITWRDSVNVTGQIDTRFNGSIMDMVFGHLYNSGYQTSDVMTLRGNGYVGIGTTAPLGPFQVKIGATEAVYISPNGNVGLGTTTPAAKLDISGASSTLSNTSGDITVNSASNNVSFSGDNLINISNITIGGTINAGSVFQNGVPISGSYTAGNGMSLSGTTFKLGGALTENMRLNIGSTESLYIAYSNGFVGIGTTSPNANLELNGTFANTAAGDVEIGYNLNFSNDTASYIRALSPLIIEAGDANSAEDLTLRSRGYGDVYIGTNSVFKYTGNVGINTNNPNYVLTVNGQPAANGYTAFTNYSDARLKTNITGLNAGYLAKVMELKPSTFNYNALTGYDQETQNRTITGFIAQDLQNVFPEMVGKTKINGVDYLDTNLSALPIYLVKAIQEQNQQITPVLQDLSLTQTGQISVNMNVSEEVLRSLGYDQTKNEITAAQYSLTDSIGKTVSRISQFGNIFAAKIETGLLSAQNIIAQRVVSNLTVSDAVRTNIISPLSDKPIAIDGSVDIKDSLTVRDIQTSSVVTNDLKSNTASVSSIYSDFFFTKEGSITDIMSQKIASLRDEIKQIVNTNIATNSAQFGNNQLAVGSSSWGSNISNDSTSIPQNVALTGEMIVGSKLTVIGDSILGNAFITGTFSNGQIAIKDNFIETTNEALYIQPSGLGSVHILGDSLVIADTGDVVVSGNLHVKGSLFANLIQASEATISGKLTVGSSDPSVATTSANLALDVHGGLNANKINVATDSAQTIIAQSGFAALATSSAELVSNATAGTASLPAGKTEIIIRNNKITSQSMVYLTPVGSTNNQVVYLKSKFISPTPTPETATSSATITPSTFTIALDQPLTKNIDINWWIIN